MIEYLNVAELMNNDIDIQSYIKHVINCLSAILMTSSWLTNIASIN